MVYLLPKVNTSQKCWLFAILKDWLRCTIIDLERSRIVGQSYHFAELLNYSLYFKGFRLCVLGGGGGRTELTVI